MTVTEIDRKELEIELVSILESRGLSTHDEGSRLLYVSLSRDLPHKFLARGLHPTTGMRVSYKPSAGDTFSFTAGWYPDSSPGSDHSGIVVKSTAPEYLDRARKAGGPDVEDLSRKVAREASMLDEIYTSLRERGYHARIEKGLGSWKSTVLRTPVLERSMIIDAFSAYVGAVTGTAVPEAYVSEPEESRVIVPKKKGTGLLEF